MTVMLVEGRDMLAMDEEGTSDPYCKFRCEESESVVSVN